MVAAEDAAGPVVTLAANTLSLERGGASVLRDVSAAFEPGTITAVCGPNGAGKSSLLLTLAGLLGASAGDVTLNGSLLAELSPRERSKAIGYLPQNGEIAWDVAVESLVALGRMPHRDRGQVAIDSAITALALEPLRHRPVSQLSGGERARVLLARVLAGEPQWILADEPLAALDLAHQQSLIAHLSACKASGQGIVLVLHDLATAMNHADHIVVLDGGKLAAEGAPDAALAPEIIEQVWGVAARWIGEAGAQALVIDRS